MLAVSSFNPLSIILAVTSVFPKSSPDEGVGGVGGVGEGCFEVEEFQIYRQAELNRTTASLLANGAILIVGEEGSGKSVLGNAVVERLTDDGFLLEFRLRHDKMTQKD